MSIVFTYVTITNLINTIQLQNNFSPTRQQYNNKNNDISLDLLRELFGDKLFFLIILTNCFIIFILLSQALKGVSLYKISNLSFALNGNYEKYNFT